MVTETDRAVEAALVTGIRGEYPGHQFIGEEDTAEAKGGNVAPLTGQFISVKVCNIIEIRTFKFI